MKLIIYVGYAVIIVLLTYFLLQNTIPNLITKTIVKKQITNNFIDKLRAGIKDCNIYCISQNGYNYKGFIESINNDTSAECWCLKYELPRGNQTELPTEDN